MDARGACYRFYWAAQRLIAPALQYSQSIYEEVLWRSSDEKNTWLDLGCGHQLLPAWRFEQERSLVKKAKLLVGLDYDYESLKKHRTIEARVRGSISRLPFASGSFDLVTSNMVFEHLDDPNAHLAEILRVLKPGGMLVFHTPNLHGYVAALTKMIPRALSARLAWVFEKRRGEDVFSTYYRINTPRKIEEVARSVGFEIVSLRLIVSSALLVMIPPLAVLELLYIRLLMTRPGRPFRTNIIAILRKRGDVSHLSPTDGPRAAGE